MSEAPKEIWCSTGMYYQCKHGRMLLRQRKEWLEGKWSAGPDLTAIKYVRADRIEELEAKLAKAVELALVECPFRWGTPSYDKWWHDRRTTLAELKGETDE